MRPNERRNKIIERLSFRREDTMGNLAEEFGVSWHTIYRDVQQLEEEYRIDIKRGHGGGISLPKGYYISDRHPTPKQAKAIEKIFRVYMKKIVIHFKVFFWILLRRIYRVP